MAGDWLVIGVISGICLVNFGFQIWSSLEGLVIFGFGVFGWIDFLDCWFLAWCDVGCWVAGFGFCVGLLWFWVLRFGWVSFLLWVGGFSCDSLGVLPAVLVLLWGWYNMVILIWGGFGGF